MSSEPSQQGRLLFDRATQFHHAEHVLLYRADYEGQHPYPVILCSSFASEAYLKSLLLIERGNHPEVHNLLGLFELLSLDSQREIRRGWEKENTAVLHEARRNRPKGARVAKTFRGALAMSSEAFVEWRYHDLDTSLSFALMTFPKHVRLRILRLEPTWDAPLGHPFAILNTAN